MKKLLGKSKNIHELIQKPAGKEREEVSVSKLCHYRLTFKTFQSLSLLQKTLRAL